MRRGSALALGFLLLAACAAQESGPPEILYGLEECSACRMIISEERYAAAITREGFETLKFDDLGCMLRSRGKIAENAEIWVHDVDTGEWVDGTAAWYLRSDPTLTPMGSGVLAFSARALAVQRGGPDEQIYDWTALLEQGDEPAEPIKENS